MSEILRGKKFKCAFCKGSGIQPRLLKSRCIACRGKGEVEFEGPVMQCSVCYGKGRTAHSSILSCVHCRGVGVVEKNKGDRDIAEVIGGRLGEVVRRLRWTRKETEKKTKEIEKRFRPISSFIKEFEKETLKRGKLTLGQALWLNKLGNNLKKVWKSLWKQ